MALQESIYSDTTLSDFSTALLKASNKSQKLQSKRNKSVNISPDYRASPANHNLNSLLSQIQDDGPAYTDSVKKDNFLNQKNNNDAAVNNQHESRLSRDDILPVISRQRQQDRKMNTVISEKRKNNSIWFLFFLMLFVIVALAITLFKLDSRTSELEESLNLYDTSLQDSIVAQAQNKDFSLNLTKTNKKLQSVQQELQLIKTDYDVLDEKYTEFTTSRDLPQTDEAVLMQDNVGALKHELVTLKSELLLMRNKFITTDKNSAGITVANRGWVVNLASLTNKNKAEEIFELLYEEGLSPLIQQAVVKGRQVYRLSVSGFLNREEAELFIRKAGPQYGTKDGRIRKN